MRTAAKTTALSINVKNSTLEWIALRSKRQGDALKELARKVPKAHLAAMRERPNSITAGYWPKNEGVAPPVIAVYLLAQDNASQLFYYGVKKTLAELATIKEMARMRRFHQYR